MVWSLLVLLTIGFWIWSLVSLYAPRINVGQRRMRAKVLWVLLIVFLSLLGSLLYLVIPRPNLKASAV